jgi:hypothetical protein
VQVHVGPLASTGALAWIGYARAVLDRARAGRGHADVHLDAEVIDAFGDFLDEWEEVAEADDEFLWVGEIDPERVEFLAHALSNVAAALAAAADHRGFAEAPAEGEAFYQSVVTGFLDALSLEGGSIGVYARELRASWPGLEA